VRVKPRIAEARRVLLCDVHSSDGGPTGANLGSGSYLFVDVAPGDKITLGMAELNALLSINNNFRPKRLRPPREKRRQPQSSGVIANRRRDRARLLARLPASGIVMCIPKIVGPLGLEPRTKGFTSAPPFPEGVDYLFTPVGCGTL
jgi:hypothetical protein